MPCKGDLGLSRLIVAAIFGIVTAFIIEFGGVIEGRFFPVMGPLRVFDPVQNQHSENLTVFHGEARKLRGCEYKDIEWFLGPRGGRRVQVIAHFLDAPEIRQEGQLLEWSGLAVGLPARDVLQNSHADVIHQCPGRPWLTRTPFYDSEVE